MKVALYCRVSSDAQDVELSIGAQLAALREFARKETHVVTHEFVDEAESGRTADRPRFREMLALARLELPPFEGILVWKMNRFARDRHDSVTLKHILAKKGIRVISITEPLDESPAGRMLEGIIESLDEYYSLNLGQDISRGMRQAAASGYFVGGRAPYGYRRKALAGTGKVRWTLEVYEPEAALVRRAFNRAGDGIGLRRIATELADANARTPASGPWTTTALHKLIRNEAYTGVLVWGKTMASLRRKPVVPPIRIEGAWPEVVDRALFDRAGALMRSRSRSSVHPRVAGSTYLLSGMLRCGACGAAMVGHAAKSSRFRYYKCSARDRRGAHACTQTLVPVPGIESGILRRLQDHLLSDANIRRIVELVNEEARARSLDAHLEREQLEQKGRDLHARLQRYYAAFEAGLLNPADLGPRVIELNQELAGIKAALAAVAAQPGGRPVSVADVLPHVADLKSLLGDSDPATRKAVIRSFVRKVTVSGANVRVEYTAPLTETAAGSDRTAVLPTIPFGGPK